MVREALVIPAQTGILEITRAEGEKVGKGQQVALVYRDSQAQNSQAQIEEMEVEIQLLEEAIAQSGDLESAAAVHQEHGNRPALPAGLGEKNFLEVVNFLCHWHM